MNVQGQLKGQGEAVILSALRSLKGQNKTNMQSASRSLKCQNKTTMQSDLRSLKDQNKSNMQSASRSTENQGCTIAIEKVLSHVLLIVHVCMEIIWRSDKTTMQRPRVQL